ncbi:MAG: fructose-bisphosphatase class I, partial [Thiomicrospira sp.]
GGLSTTGREHIMDVEPKEIHQRCPVMLGSKNEVEKAMSYLKN